MRSLTREAHLCCRTYSYPRPLPRPFMFTRTLFLIAAAGYTCYRNSTDNPQCVLRSTYPQSSDGLPDRAQIPTRTGQTASTLIRVLTKGRGRLESPHPDLTVGRIGGFLWAFGNAPFFSWLADGSSFLQVSLATTATVHRPRHRTHYTCSLHTPLTASDSTVVFDIHPHFLKQPTG
jgi:hypothetical protein